MKLTGKTIEQRKAELRAELDRLDILEQAASEIKSFIETCDSNIEYYCKEDVIVGYEEAQATNSGGEPLYTIDNKYWWGAKTKAQLDEMSEEDRSKYTPHHKPITETIVHSIEELEIDSYQLRNIQKWQAVKTALEECRKLL